MSKVRQNDFNNDLFHEKGEVHLILVVYHLNLSYTTVRMSLKFSAFCVLRIIGQVIG